MGCMANITVFFVNIMDMAGLVEEHSPIAISGDRIEYQINRNQVGWVVELVNNAGVIKTKDQPAIVELEKVARVNLQPRFAFTEARQWTAGESLSLDPAQEIVVPPGETVFVEFVVVPVLK